MSGVTKAGRASDQSGRADVEAHTHSSAKRHAVARTGGQRALVVGSLAERISLTRCIALYPSAFYSVRKGYELSVPMGSHNLKLPASEDLVFNPQLGKTLRTSIMARPG